MHIVQLQEDGGGLGGWMDNDGGGETEVGVLEMERPRRQLSPNFTDNAHCAASYRSHGGRKTLPGYESHEEMISRFCCEAGFFIPLLCIDKVTNCKLKMTDL